MSVHQCPKCELRFSWVTEVDDHCRQDHPDFQHEYLTARARDLRAARARPVQESPPRP